MAATQPIITVTSPHELSVAVNELSDAGGGTILVEKSDEAYSLEKYRPGSEAGEIRIVAADPENPPIFEKVRLIEGKNMSFEGLSFDTSDSSVKRATDVEFLSCEGISFVNNTLVSGSTEWRSDTRDVEVGHSFAMIRDSSDVVFSGNIVSNYNHGLTVIDSVDLTLSNNHISQMTGDGMRLSGIQNSLIEGNTFENFLGSANTMNHDDMLQVWSASYNELNTENLTIRGNFFNSGGGEALQSIFIKNETYSQTGTKYQNIVIEDNVIHGAERNGLVVYDTDGLTVSNNTLLWDPQASSRHSEGSDPKSHSPQIRLEDVENLDMKGNISGSYTVQDHDITGNAILEYSDPTAENYVGANFVNPTGGLVDLRDLALLPDSPWAGGNYGSSAIQPATSGDLTAVMRQDHDHQTVTYDAGLSYGPDGYLDPADTTFTWTFSDGTVMTGPQVTRNFEPGSFDVTLSVSGPYGTDTIDRTTLIEPDTLLDIDFSTGTDTSEYGSSVEIEGDLGEGGFQLSDQSQISIDRSNDQLQMMETFGIDMTLRLDTADSSGTFLYMHKSLRADITGDGALRFIMSPQDQRFELVTEPGLFTDTESHRIVISYDSHVDGLNLYVDDVLVGSLPEATGLLDGDGQYDLVTGHPWGATLPATIEALTIRKSPTSWNEEDTDDAFLDQDTSFASEDSDLDLPDSDDLPGKMLLDIGFEGPIRDASAYESAMIAHADGAAPAEGVSGDGFRLTGTSSVEIDRFNEQLQSMSDFVIDISLKRDTDGDAGSFLHMHKSLRAEVTEDGALRFTMSPEDQVFQAETRPGLINADETWHDIRIQYDPGNGGLMLHVDGTLEAQVEEAHGTLDGDGSHDLTLGDTWNDSLQGVVDNLKIYDVAEVPETEEEAEAPLPEPERDGDHHVETVDEFIG